MVESGTLYCAASARMGSENTLVTSQTARVHNNTIHKHQAVVRKSKKCFSSCKQYASAQIYVWKIEQRCQNTAQTLNRTHTCTSSALIHCAHRHYFIQNSLNSLNSLNIMVI